MAPKPLVVIVGPTASGKTALAIELAEKFNGEIVSADSRAVYKGMDIGTAKPNETEKLAVPHWGLDIVNPDEKFTTADFKKYAVSKIKEIQSRGKVPFLVGGTGLYIDSVILDYKFGSESDPLKREALQELTVEELKEYCINNNIDLPENENNKRHLIRMIETSGQKGGRNKKPSDNTIVVGITTDKPSLLLRINNRIEQMLDDGIVDEAKKLGKKYGWNCEPMKSNIYPIIYQFLNGQINLDELKKLSVTKDWQLAKRQMTWFKRNDFIKWMNLGEAFDYLSDILQS